MLRALMVPLLSAVLATAAGAARAQFLTDSSCRVVNTSTDLCVSLDPPTRCFCDIPEVKGRKLGDAITAFRTNHFTNIGNWSAPTQNAVVAVANVPEGKQVACDTQIRLYCQVPMIAPRTTMQIARELLNRSGIAASADGIDPSDPVEGIDESIVECGKTVQLHKAAIAETVPHLPVKCVLPPISTFVQASVGEAEQFLRAAGFKIVILQGATGKQLAEVLVGNKRLNDQLSAVQACDVPILLEAGLQDHCATVVSSCPVGQSCQSNPVTVPKICKVPPLGGRSVASARDLLKSRNYGFTDVAMSADAVESDPVASLGIKAGSSVFCDTPIVLRSQTRCGPGSGSCPPVREPEAPQRQHGTPPPPQIVTVPATHTILLILYAGGGFVAGIIAYGMFGAGTPRRSAPEGGERADADEDDENEETPAQESDSGRKQPGILRARASRTLGSHTWEQRPPEAGDA